MYTTRTTRIQISATAGWRLNYSQSIEEVSFQNGNKAQTFFKLTDGDGTRHYYKNSRIRQQNTLMSLTEFNAHQINTGSKLITVSEQGGNKLVFEYGTYNGRKQGRLTSVEDANGNKILIEYRIQLKNDLRISAVREKLPPVNLGATA